MIYPSIDDLIKKVDSKYTLVIATAKRARQIKEKEEEKNEKIVLKEVSMALKEIDQGAVTYNRFKDGVK